ncbi:MAG: Flp family type IVb pilin [Notoacmeibacter sp.]|nr:Flp family type IVb pilin [Notoacmeibacter sp.]MCB1440992.1 Flp family type IVb pilin [Nitratireductor sp.]
MTTIRRFFEDISGATAVEYGLIVAVLSLSVVAGISQVHNAIEFLFSDTTSDLNTAFN